MATITSRAFKAARAAYAENFKARHCSRDGYGAAGLALHDNFIEMGSQLWWVMLELVCRCPRPGVERIIANSESSSDEF